MNTHNPSTPMRRLTRWCKMALLGAAFALLGDAANAQNVTVNPGAGSYPTLTAAFAAINAGTHTGAITVAIIGNTTEGAGTAILNASGSGAASYTSISIQPSGGAARTISGGTTAGSPMIDFSGADNVTVDGLNTGGNSLTIENTTVSATSGTSTIRFIGGATSNTITRCSIKGAGTMSVATNGATIFFSTDGVTANGNDNNTISNNDIGPSGANLPTKGILGNGSTTTLAIGNSGMIINNNNIFDFFGAAVTSSGVAINGGCNTWSITNNRFYQTGTRTWTTGATHRAIDLNSSTATTGITAMTVTGNIVGYATNTQTGTYTLTGSTGKFQGIFFNGPDGGTVSALNSNTVASVSLTGVTSSGTSTSTPFVAILLQNGNGTTNSNIIGSQSATGSLTFSTTTTSATDVYGMFNFSFDDFTAISNQIGGISFTNAGASGTMLLFCMRANTTTAKSFIATSNLVGGTVANSISLTATGVSSQVIGLHTSNALANFSSNTIRNLSTNIGTGTTTTASMIGINVTTTTPNHTLSQNTIFNLTNTNATAASVVTGIQFTGATANVVERNLIYGLTAATNSATAEVNGIRVAGGTTQYRNNMIAIGAGIANALGAVPSNSATQGINGINEALGTNQFFHNSVYIGGTATAGTGASYAFNGTQTVNTRSFRDNIFFNARTNSGATGIHYAIKLNGTVANPTGLTINNNLYFANGLGAVFGFYNSAPVANVAAWRIAVGQDAQSFEGNPQYNDPTNATPDLHLHPTNPTVAEGNGVDVGVTNDYDGQTRASLTPVDIGADAGNYVTIDLAGPIISYTALGNTTSVANRIQSTTITDSGSGVPVAGAGLPVIYFRKNAGAYFSNQCVSTGGSGYDCTINNALVGGVIVGDQIDYYIAAQDQAGTPNVSANPSSGASGFSSNPPAVSTAPTTPNSYVIAAAISGIIPVGTAETFKSLTVNNAQGVFRYINSNVVVGNITIQLTSDLTIEDGAVALNAFPSPFTVTVIPMTTTRIISGAAASTALIRTNGASRFSIDGSIGGGGTDRSLTITNTSVTAPQVVRFQSIGVTPFTDNTLKNCIIRNGVNTSSAVVLTDGAGAAEYFNNITIQNNDIGTAFIGVFANAVLLAGNGSGLTYTQNKLDNSGATAIRLVGLYAQGVDGATISDNILGNFSTADGENDAAIWLATGTVNSTVSGNTISALNFTAASAFSPHGIRITPGVAAANIMVRQNTISNMTSNGISSANLVAGISITGTSGGITLERNNVQNISNTATDTWPAVGIDLNGGNNNVVRNNFVANVTSDQIAGTGAFTPTFGATGIRLFLGTGHQVYNNSVHLYGAQSGAVSTLLVSALSMSSTTTGCDVRNNILSNQMTGGNTGGNTRFVGINLPSGLTSTYALTLNNNAYYEGTNTNDRMAVVGVTVGSGDFAAANFNAGVITPATNFRSYSSTLSAGGTNDNASTASVAAVPFLSNTNLHITTAAPEFATGATIATVTNDIDGDTRPQGLSYDKGADEVLYSCSAAATAGGPQTICSLGTTAVGLGGNTPVAPAAGAWTIITGGVTGTFNPTAATPNATFTHTGGAGPVTVRWTITQTDCATSTADVVITINTPSTANAGGPYSTCGTDPASISATASGAGTWSGGAGTFASATSLSTTYTPTAGEVGTTVVLTWTTTGNSPCPNVPSNANLVVETPATANAGGPYSTCGTDPASISATASGAGTWSGGAGTFASATSLSTTYTPTAGEVGSVVVLTWTTTGTSPCPNVPSNANLTVTTPATANAGGPYSACGTSAVNISATANGPGTWSGGTGTFGSATSASTTYTPSIGEVGTAVNITWTTTGTAPCPNVPSNATVNVSTPATANAGGPYSTCGTIAVNITATANGTGTWSGGAGTFGSATSLSTTYTPTVGESGSVVVLTWTTDDPDGAGACTSTPSNANLTVNALPVVTCGSYGPACVTDPDILLGGSPVGGTWTGTGVTGNNFDPSAGTQTLTYTYFDGTCTNFCQTTITVVNTCNDLCTNAIALSCNSTTSGSTAGTTADAVPTCGGTTLNTAGGVWYTVVGTGGNITASLCGSSYDSEIGVFTTPDCVAFTCVAGNNNFCALNGQVTFASILGQTYYILVTGFGTATGSYTLQVVCNGDGNCNNNGVKVELRTDDFGSETSWEITPVGNTIPVCSGSGYSDNATISVDCCLLDGCYILTFFDVFGDAMSVSTPAGEGGYRLVTATGKRIIDNWKDGQDFDNPTGGYTSRVANGFCVPIGATQLTIATCDKENLNINDVIVSGIDPAVSADYPDPTSGYQFWVYNPDGGYSRRLYRAHGATSCIASPSGPTLAAHLRLNCLNSSLPNLPCDTLLNVRVRPRLNGAYGEFGPACRMKVLCTPVACPTTQLDNNPLHAGTTLSCDVTGKVVGVGGNNGKLFPNIVPGANRYQYEFVLLSESYTRTIATSCGSYALTLSNWATNPLICGTFTYDVRVRVSFDCGATYCPYGPVCTVGITNNPPNYCTAPFQGGGGQNSMLVDEDGMTLWPNPVRNGNVTLNLNGLSSDVMTASVDIFDMFGKKVMTTTLATDGAAQVNTVLELKDLATGMYTVNVISGSQSFTNRLVIE